MGRYVFDCQELLIHLQVIYGSPANYLEILALVGRVTREKRW